MDEEWGGHADGMGMRGGVRMEAVWGVKRIKLLLPCTSC